MHKKSDRLALMSKDLIPQSEKSVARKPLSWGKGVLTWFSKEAIGNWGYEQLGVLGRSAIMTTAFALVVRFASTIPLDLLLIAALFIAAIVFFSIQRLIDRRRKRQTVLPESETGETEKLVTENEEEKLEQYKLLLEKADEQREGIGEYVKLKETYFCYQHLAAPERLRSVFALDILNKSVFNITIEDAVEGYIKFEGIRLKENPRIINTQIKAAPASEASITIEQPLTRAEADFIESQNLQFAEFDLENLIITITGSEPSEKVKSQPLEITHKQRIVRVNKIRKDSDKLRSELEAEQDAHNIQIAELSERIKELEEEKAARQKPNITGEIKEVYLEKWANKELWQSDPKHMYFDYHFIVNTYLANHGAPTTIKQFNLVLKRGRSYIGEKERDPNWRAWGEKELVDIETLNDVPLEYTRNGWLWFVVIGVQENKRKSKMELELYAIDKDETSYKLITLPSSQWQRNPFVYEAHVAEARARMQREF